MSDITGVLSALERGDPHAAEQLLPLVYDELRKLAATRLAHEQPGQTLQATALVHEAYVRLVDADRAQTWDSRGHFFAAAAEAMRRILVDRAREKASAKRGGGLDRVNIDAVDLVSTATPDSFSTVQPQFRNIDRVFPRFFEGSGLQLENIVPRLYDCSPDYP